MQTLIADLEGNGLLPALDTIWQISIAEEGSTDVESYHHDTLMDGFERLCNADRVVFHNGIGYDHKAFLKVFKKSFDIHKMIDTLVLSRLGNPERPGGHSLAAWGDTLGFPKMEHDDWSKWTPEMEMRCNTDVLLLSKIWNRLKPMLDLMPEACEIERLTAIAVDQMCTTGVHFDEPAARKLLYKLLDELDVARTAALDAMPKLYFPKTKNGEVIIKNLKVVNSRHWGKGQLDPGTDFSEVVHKQLDPGSRQDVALFLKRKYGWKPIQKTPTGQPKVNDDILRALPWPEAKVFAEYYKVEKLVGQLNSEIKKNGTGGGWLHHVTSEGKLHANFIPLKAVTGRPSCVAPNLQQVSTDPRARSLFLPRPGWKLLGVDADGQELRCLGHYLWPFDGGEYAKEVVEGDIHSRIQKLIGFNSRNITKNVEYSIIYGAQNPRLGLYAAEDALTVGGDISFNLAERGKQIRQAIISGVKGFEELTEAVKVQAKSSGRLRGLDGRTLWVRSPHSALNLLLQSCGIIHMKKAISILGQRLADAGYEFGRDWELVLWVHDEVQLQAPPETAEGVGTVASSVIEEAGKLLGIRTPMTGTYQIGDNWKETH